MYFDSHSHLTDERFHDDLSEVLTRAGAASIEGVVTIASDVEDGERILALLRRESAGLAADSPSPRLWGTIGIHPHVVGAAGGGDMERVHEIAETEESIVAIGETGLDFHYDNSPREVQRRRFQEQMSLAAELGLPVVAHSRDAEEDTLAMIRERGGEVRGVLHCFTGGPELLEGALEAGWYVSLAGIASFSKFAGAESVRRIPANRLLVETDAPYLAPVPRRGRRNEPAFLVHVVEAVARLRGEEVAAVRDHTRRNALRFYDLPAP